jgi:hypothetical protein
MNHDLEKKNRKLVKMGRPLKVLGCQEGIMMLKYRILPSYG